MRDSAFDGGQVAQEVYFPLWHNREELKNTRLVWGYFAFEVITPEYHEYQVKLAQHLNPTLIDIPLFAPEPVVMPQFLEGGYGIIGGRWFTRFFYGF